MDITGQKIGPYTIERLIGHGGMGNVYLAAGANGQKVALKLLHMHMTAIPEYVKRFQMEATLARKLTHPNVVRVLDCGQVGEQHFIAMEYIEGESLAQRMERGGIVAPGIKWTGGAEDAAGMASIVDTAMGGRKSRKPAVQYQSYCGPAPALEPPVRNLPIAEAIKIMRQVAGVLQAASDIGLVHQDLKPHNILLDRQGNAKVLDFGLAKDADTVSTIHETTGQSLGTPHYMSPEQCHGGRKVDIRSDLYSLGVTGYQMLTGRTPFLGPTAMLLMSQHINEIPVAAAKVNPAVPKNLSLVLDRLLAKRRSDRHQTPAELIVDLDRVEHGEAPLKVFRPRRSRRFGLVWMGVAAAVGITLGLVAMLTAPYWPGRTSLEARIQDTRVKAERLWKDKKFDEAVAVLTPMANKWSDQYPDLKRMLDRI
jgi:serine/threonine-protein kinase